MVRRQPDLLEQPAHARLGFVAAGDAMHQQRLHDRVAHRHARVERGERVLEDELDVAAQRLHVLLGQLEDVAAVELDGAALALDQAQQRAAGGRLAAARFTDQRQRLARMQVEAQLLHRMHAARDAAEEAAAQVEARDQVLHAQDGRLVRAHRVLRHRGHRCRVAVDPQQLELCRQVGAAHRAELRHGRQQGARVGVARLREDLFRRTGLDLVAAVHHEHAVGHFGHHAHVVRDEEHAHLHLGLQLADELEDLRLDGHVERGRRLVGDQQRRLARQRHRDHHALAHAARELVRKAVEHVLRFGDAHQFEHAQRLGARGGAVLGLMDRDGLGDLVARGEHGVQRRHRLLEDHRDVGAADAAHRGVGRARQIEHLAVAAAEGHAAVDDAAAAVFHQPHQRERGHGLARARLADDGQRLAAFDMEGQVLDRIDHPFGGRESDVEVVDRQHAALGQGEYGCRSLGRRVVEDSRHGGRFSDGSRCAALRRRARRHGTCLRC
jgi:hypothetical protein